MNVVHYHACSKPVIEGDDGILECFQFDQVSWIDLDSLEAITSDLEAAKQEAEDNVLRPKFGHADD